MKIAFDLRNTGLGNNGGSSTLVKSANTLVDLGHNIIFIDSGKNQHTWSKLKAEHIIVNNNNLPPSDFLIATGYKSVSKTIIAPKTSGIKCHWIRGWELWNGNEQWINNNILKAPTIKFVNGLCLKRKLESFKCESYLVRPGYDFDYLTPLNIRNGKYIIIGGLNKQGKHLNTKRTQWIFDTVTTLRNRFGNIIKLYMFGMDKFPNDVVDEYIRNPTDEQKNILYNKCDIWLSTSILEGLHMPPAEAMITECPVVGTQSDMSGTEDYLNKNTGLVVKNNLNSLILGTEELINNKQLRLHLGKNGRNKILSIGNRQENMKKFIKILETL